MLAKTTALDRKTAVIEKTQKNKRGDLRGMGRAPSVAGVCVFCNQSIC
jgi:hypothetical protein